MRTEREGTSGRIREKLFHDIDAGSRFFDSLKEDYPGFVDWFERKSREGEKAFVLEDRSGNLQAFLYLKIENDDGGGSIQPPLPPGKKLKIGTFKVDPHGTRLGERFLKIAMDRAFYENSDYIYVTVFKKHSTLIRLFEEFGFLLHGKKTSSSGKELVFIKSFWDETETDVVRRYPRISLANNPRIYVLGIYPEYHTVLFPDSILNTENPEELIVDVSYTNGIYKYYLGRIHGLENLRYGDIILIYRTKEKDARSAYYSSVLTSICTVLEVRRPSDFSSFEEFYRYCRPYTVFGREELLRHYGNADIKIVKMTYNAALSRRLTSKYIRETLGTPRYWGFFELSRDDLFKVMKDGRVPERLLIT